MKLISKILISTLFVISLNSFSQNFAPIGAEWYYTNIESFFSPNQGYVKIKSVSDTIMQGINYRRLTKIRFDSNGSFSSESDEYIYNSGDTVYRLSDNDTNYVLYSFSAGIGDTWTTRTYDLYAGQDVESEMIVDSLSSIIINGDTLKVLYVSRVVFGGMSFGGFWLPAGGQAKIIEKLGGSWYMFPQDYGFWDFEIRIGLRCYSDSIFGFYDAGITPNCTELIVGIDELNISDNIVIYPNPTNSIFNLKLNNFNNFVKTTFKLFEITGKAILTKEINLRSTQIDVSQYQKGIYFYQLTNQDNSFSGKLIIQ